MRCIFLDRDGTINVDRGYSNKIEDLEILGYPEIIHKLYDVKKLGFYIIVITNQAGAELGYFSEEDIIKFNEELNRNLNYLIDKIYYCPHYSGCECRKPNTGLIKKAQEDFDIDLELSWVIGDKAADINLGKKIGAKTILVLTGHGLKEAASADPDFVAKDINQALSLIYQIARKEIYPIQGYAENRKLLGLTDSKISRSFSRQYNQIWIMGKKEDFKITTELPVDFIAKAQNL